MRSAVPMSRAFLFLQRSFRGSYKKYLRNARKTINCTSYLGDINIIHVIA
jgi:hypothetical protein